jgi:hypothetical protein
LALFGTGDYLIKDKILDTYFINMVYYIVACTKQGQDENSVEQIVKNNVLANGSRPLGELYPLTKSIDKTQFKLGSLDELM